MTWFGGCLPLTVPVLEVHALDDLAHAQNIRGSAENVQAHPSISGIQSGERLDGLGSLAGVVCISPGSHDRTQDHKPEGKEGEGSNAASKPQNFAIGNDNDGQILENGVHGNREILEGLGACVDHADEEEGDGEP